MRHELFPPVGQRQPLAERRDERLSFDLMAELKTDTSGWRRARVTDMSVRGFKIAWFPNAIVGRSVMIRIPGIEPLPAIIRRAGAEGVGCEFVRPLSTYVLDHLASHAAGGSRR